MTYPTHDAANRPDGLRVIFPDLSDLYRHVLPVLPLAEVDEWDGTLYIATGLKAWSDGAITIDNDAFDDAAELDHPTGETLADQLADSLDVIDPAEDFAALADIAAIALNALAATGWETPETIAAARYLTNIAKTTRNN